MRHDVLEKYLPMRAEWKSYSLWRFRQLVDMYIHNLELAEYEGQRSDHKDYDSGQVAVNASMIEGHFQKMETWERHISVVRQICNS